MVLSGGRGMGGGYLILVARGAGLQKMAETWRVRRMKMVRPMMRWLSSNLDLLGRPRASPTPAPAVPAR